MLGSGGGEGLSKGLVGRNETKKSHKSKMRGIYSELLTSQD